MVSLSESILTYVVNASWQTIVIVLVAALASLLLRTAPARYRHVLWLTTLAACVIVPLLTLTQKSAFNESVLIPVPTRPAVTAVSAESDSAPLLNLTKRRTQVVNTTSESTSLLLGVYALFIVWRIIRLVRFWRRKETLRFAAGLKPLSPSVESIAQHCQTILGVANISVAQSSSARVPFTIGARRPLIVVPETFCTASEERLLSVIGHEMAHVARRDYLTNLICELITLPISFHPLTFVIKRQIDRARELACDELVSKRLLPPKLYARSLVWAADVSAQPRTAALMLTMFDARILEERVMRLTRNRRVLSRRAARAIASVALFALGASTVMLSLFSFELKTQAHAVLMPSASIGSNISNIFTSATQTPRKPQSPQQSRPERTLSAPSAQERAEAACEAGRASDTEKIPALIAMLADESRTELLRCWNTGRWSPALDTFKQPSPGEQAAIALASMGRSAFQPLVNQLDNGNAAVRRNAAWAIGELTNMPPGERDSAVPQLVSLLSDSDEWVRMAAARALGEVRDRSVVVRLVVALSDSDWRVRQLVVWALSELKDDRAVATLCSVLLSDTREEVRRGAAEALGEIRSAAALPSLKQALNDPAVSAKAQWAISEIEDTDGQ